MRCIWSKWLGWYRNGWWTPELEWVLASLADKIIAEIKINSPLPKCWGIMSITPIKVNDVILNNIYWERGKQQLWHPAFRGEMVNKMWRPVALIGLWADDGESGCDGEEGMLRSDCKSSSLHNNAACARKVIIQPHACRWRYLFPAQCQSSRAVELRASFIFSLNSYASWKVNGSNLFQGINICACVFCFTVFVGSKSRRPLYLWGLTVLWGPKCWTPQCEWLCKC